MKERRQSRENRSSTLPRWVTRVMLPATLAGGIFLTATGGYLEGERVWSV